MTDKRLTKKDLIRTISCSGMNTIRRRAFSSLLDAMPATFWGCPTPIEAPAESTNVVNSTWNNSERDYLKAIVRRATAMQTSLRVAGFATGLSVLEPYTPLGLYGEPLDPFTIRWHWENPPTLVADATEIDLSLDGIVWSLSVSDAPNVITYTHGPLQPGATWYARIRAQNSWGFSDYSPIATATTPYVDTSLFVVDLGVNVTDISEQVIST